MSVTMDIFPSTQPRWPTDAADHLANERTFLAWIRTSLAVIGLGFAVAKFGTWLRELSGQSELGLGRPRGKQQLGSRGGEVSAARPKRSQMNGR